VKRLTPNEKYLLEIICRLRGNAYDSWGRLNAIRSGKETVRRAAPKTDLKVLEQELRGVLHQDHTGGHGAHLPHPNDPHFTSETKHRILTRHRRAMKAGKTLTSVFDLVKPAENRHADRVSARINRKYKRT
jgi:hypothetical protein